MATKNRIKSVYTTPLNPPKALKIIVTKPAPTTVCQGSKFNITPPIFMAAKVTDAIVITLKITPK